MRWHWQNLNEKWVAEKRVKGNGLRHGRAWFHFGQGEGWDAKVLRVEWSLGGFDCALYVSLNGSEHEVLFHIAVPLVSIYLATNVSWKWLWKKTGYDHWKLGFRIFDWAFWWSGFENEMSMSSKDKWYRRFCFHIDDFILGRKKYTKIVHGTPKRIWIPLPEGQYLAEAVYETATWKRRHWPFWPLTVVHQSTVVEVISWHGLPHEGKGENSWDCGTDGLFGYSSAGHDLEKAIAKGVESTLQSRKRYGGSRRGYYPDPHITQIEGVKAFAEQHVAGEKRRVKYPKWGRVWYLFENDGNIVIIKSCEESKYNPLGFHCRAITTTQELAAKWEELLYNARLTVTLKDDDSVAEAAAT